MGQRKSKKKEEKKGKKRKGENPAQKSKHGLQTQTLFVIFLKLYLDVCHIDFVHIRPLLSVHFYRNKLVIEDLCNLFTFKGFSFHYMTPMASGITHWKGKG